ncbi:hypothetical protein [Streptomyces sp. TE33382]
MGTDIAHDPSRTALVEAVRAAFGGRAGGPGPRLGDSPAVPGFHLWLPGV